MEDFMSGKEVKFLRKDKISNFTDSLSSWMIKKKREKYIFLPFLKVQVND